MDKFRKVIAAIGLVAMLSTLVVSTAVAGTFDDVPTGEWYAPFVDDLVAAGIVDDANSNFRPADTMNRAEALKLAVEACGNEGTTDIDFPDVSTDAWFYSYVQTGVANGIVDGYDDGFYRPGNNVNRAEFAKMLVNACDLPDASDMANPFSDVPTTGWFHDTVLTAYHWMVLDGYTDGTFRPGNDILRAEAAKMTAMAMDPVMRDETTPVEPEPSASGDLDVSISSSTAVGATLPSGATSVEMATWDFTAGSKSAMLGSLEIHRFGVSTIPSDAQVYLYDGTERLTSGKTVNSTTNLAIFNNLNLDIPSGTTTSLTIRMDVGTVTTTGELGFEIEEVASVDASEGSVTGDFPVQGDKFDLSTTAAGTITLSKNGTVTDASVGENGATVAKFKIEAATELAAVSELGLYISGSVNAADLGNFKLYVSGMDDPVAEVSGVNSRDVAQFVLDTPYEIDKGDSRSFWATAEFNTGRTGDTVLIYIDETTDVVAIGDTYGYGMSVTATAYDGTTCSTGTPTECSAMTLEGGDITIAGTTITNRDIAVNQDDVSILKFTITSQSDVTFNNFAFWMDTSADTSDATQGLLSDATGTPPNFTDIKIQEVGGGHIWGPIDADAMKAGSTSGAVISESTDDAAAYYLFTDDLEMSAGESIDFEVTVDVANEAALDDTTITAAIEINATQPEIKDLNNKVLTNSTSLVPTSDYTGDAFTVEGDQLTVARSASVGSATQVVGSDDVELLALSVGSGDASDIKVTSVKVTGYIDDNGTTNLFVAGVDTVSFNEVVLNMDLYVGSVAPENKLNSTSKSANSTTGEATFDNLDWVIPAGNNVTLIVAGDLSNNTSYDTDQLKVDIADVSADIVAENEDGNDVDSSSSDLPNGGTVDNATTSTQIIISAGGTLSVDIPSATPSSEIVVAGTSGNLMSVQRFSAIDESFTINKLALKNDYSATVGDYDDNISVITLRYYSDEAQTVEETTNCSSSDTAGVYVCTGMNMMVPDPDVSGAPDYADVYVEVALNDVADDLADEGDKPNLTLSLAKEFEATGASSGKKIKNSDTYDLTVTDVALGTYSDTVTGYDAVQSDGVIVAADTSMFVDDAGGDDPGDINMVGAFLCFSETAGGATTCDAGDEQVYVTAVTDGGSDELTLIRGVNGTTAAGYPNDDTVLVIPPSTALITGYQQVQGTDIDLAAVASSRTGSPLTSEPILSFTAKADSTRDAKIRAGTTIATGTEGTDGGGANTFAANTSVSVDGSSMLLTAGASVADNDSYYFTNGSDISGNSRVSFWLYTDDQAEDQGTDTVDYTQMTLFTAADATAAGDNSSTLANPVTTPLDDTWYFFDMAIPTGTVAADVNIGFELDDISALTNDSGGFEATDLQYVDGLRLYNESINVDLTLNEDWAAITPTVAYLKQEGVTVATGYFDADGAVGSRTGQIQFTPTGSYGDIEILSTTTTFTIEMDTITAITEDSGATEKLTATIDLGNVTTAGDIRWYDGALSGGSTDNTNGIVNFLGVDVTDKITTVSSY